MPKTTTTKKSTNTKTNHKAAKKTAVTTKRVATKSPKDSGKQEPMVVDLTRGVYVEEYAKYATSKGIDISQIHEERGGKRKHGQPASFDGKLGQFPKENFLETIPPVCKLLHRLLPFRQWNK